MKEFKFPSKFGFSGSCGKVPVRGHMRSPAKKMATGGPVSILPDPAIMKVSRGLAPKQPRPISGPSGAASGRHGVVRR